MKELCLWNDDLIINNFNCRHRKTIGKRTGISECKLSNENFIVVSQSNKKNSDNEEDIELEEMDKATLTYNTHSSKKLI